MLSTPDLVNAFRPSSGKHVQIEGLCLASSPESVFKYKKIRSANFIKIEHNDAIALNMKLLGINDSYPHLSVAIINDNWYLYVYTTTHNRMFVSDTQKEIKAEYFMDIEEKIWVKHDDSCPKGQVMTFENDIIPFSFIEVENIKF